MLARLEDLDLNTQQYAITALAGVAATDSAVREAIESKLSDKDYPLWLTAINALSTVPAARESLRSAIFARLQPSRWRDRRDPIAALSTLDIDERIREFLQGILSTGTEHERIAAVKVLTGLTFSAPQIVAAIHQQAKDISSPLRMSVAEAIGSNEGSPDGLRILGEIRENRATAESLRALVQVASSAPGSLKDHPHWRSYWLKKITDNHPQGRAAAVVALAKLVRTDAESRHKVLQSLRDESSQVSFAALETLADFVTIDKDIRKVLLQKMEDEDPNIQMEAVLVSKNLITTDTEVRTAVLLKLEQDLDYIRSAALSTLSVLVERDVGVRTAVMQRLEDRASRVRADALRSLSGLVEAKLRTIFIQKLEDEDDEVKSAALSALAALVETDPQVRKVVLQRVESARLRSAAISALAKLVTTDADIFALMLQKLGDDRADVRVAAMHALAGLMKLDSRVWEAVAQRIEDQDFSVRAATVAVLCDYPEKVVNTGLWNQLRGWLALDANSWASTRQDPKEVPAKVATLLGSRLALDPDLQGWLLGELRSPRWTARAGAALSLLAWPDGPSVNVLGHIFEALDDRRGLEAYPAQLTAASYLINRNDHAQQAVDLCLEALDYGTQPWESLWNSKSVRLQATLVLSKLEPVFFNKRIYDRLLAAMESDTAPNVRDAAYRALVRLARAA